MTEKYINTHRTYLCTEKIREDVANVAHIGTAQLPP